MLNYEISTNESLLEKCNFTTLHIKSIILISTEVIKSLNKLNSSFTIEIFHTREILHDVRISIKYVTKVVTPNIKKKKLSNIGTHTIMGYVIR